MKEIVDSKLNIIKNVMCARSCLDLDIGDQGMFLCNGNIVGGVVQEVLQKQFREDVHIYRIRNIDVIYTYGLEGTDEEYELYIKHLK